MAVEGGWTSRKTTDINSTPSNQTHTSHHNMDSDIHIKRVHSHLSARSSKPSSLTQLMPLQQSSSTIDMPLLNEYQKSSHKDPFTPLSTPSNWKTRLLSQSEQLHGLANRILHSSFYKLFYLFMALSSIACVVVSIQTTCPPTWFYYLETCINGSMMVEVTLRYVAMKKIFWKSIWNMIDIILMIVCACTLIVLLFSTCSPASHQEEFADAILMSLRNIIQFIRLLVFLNKNRKKLNSSSSMISLDGLDVSSNFADIDFLQPLPVSHHYHEHEDEQF